MYCYKYLLNRSYSGNLDYSFTRPERTMHTLTDSQLYQALAYAKSIDEDTGAALIAEFQREQSGLAETVFGVFPMIIAEQNQDMSYLFMDLVFDVFSVFQHAFGPLPAQNEIDSHWLEKQAVLLDAELQSLMSHSDMDTISRNNKRVAEDGPQPGLVNFMNAAIDEFVSESPQRLDALPATQALIAIVIRLFSNLYQQTSKS